MAVDRLQELYELKNELADQLRSLGERESEWTPEDREQWDTINPRYDDCVADIETCEQQQMVATRMDALREQDEARTVARRSEVGQARHNRQHTAITEQMRGRALQGMFLRRMGKDLRPAHEEALYAMGLDRTRELIIGGHPGHIASFRCFSRNGGTKLDMSGFQDAYDRHFRQDLDTQTPTEGAEWVPGEIFMAELIQTLIAFGPIRGAVRTIVTASGVPLRLPTSDDTANVAQITPEESAVTTADPVTGEVVWGAYKYGSEVKWSAELLQDSPLNLTSILASLLGQRIGRAQSAHFTTGDGVSKPRGILLDATAGATNWELTPTNPYDNADALVDLQAELDPAYAAIGNVAWMFNRKTLAEIRKIKDANGQFIWQPGLRPGDTDLLLGDPYVMNQDMPDLGASSESIVYGDMSSYIIRDAAGMRTKMLDELYARTDQFGMIVWRRSDGRAAQPLAIIKMVSSAT